MYICIYIYVNGMAVGGHVQNNALHGRLPDGSRCLACVLHPWWSTDCPELSSQITKMQSSSADTNFTFGDNVVAVAESGNQSSPATGDSGAASGTWQNVPSRRSKSSASNRSMGRTSRRRRTILHDQAHLDHIRTDLRGPGILRLRGKQMDPSIFSWTSSSWGTVGISGRISWRTIV